MGICDFDTEYRWSVTGRCGYSVRGRYPGIPCGDLILSGADKVIRIYVA